VYAVKLLIILKSENNVNAHMGYLELDMYVTNNFELIY
jgi:hypothetical protein